VPLTSLLDTPGGSIVTFEPVYRIKCFSSSSISNETVWEPCSIRTENAGFSTAFLGIWRWRDLSSLSPLIRFPDSLPVLMPPCTFAYRGSSPVERGRLERPPGYFIPGEFCVCLLYPNGAFSCKVPSSVALVAPKFRPFSDVPNVPWSCRPIFYARTSSLEWFVARFGLFFSSASPLPPRLEILTDLPNFV